MVDDSSAAKWVVTMQGPRDLRALPVNGKGNRVGTPRQAVRFDSQAAAEEFALERMVRSELQGAIFKAELDGPDLQQSRLRGP